MFFMLLIILLTNNESFNYSLYKKVGQMNFTFLNFMYVKLCEIHFTQNIQTTVQLNQNRDMKKEIFSTYFFRNTR